jgi:AraC-like DNA-binding protein
LRASGGRHARLTRHEQELGAWLRARRPPDPRLTGLLDRELLGYQHWRAEFSSWLEPPQAQLTLMIDLDGSITADGQALPDAWIGGLADTYTLVGLGDTYGSIDLKLRPLGAYRVLGFPLNELTGQVVSLADVFGAEGPLLAERLRGVPDWDGRFDVVEEFLLGRLAQAPPIHPMVARAWQRLRETSGRVRIEALAAELGCSRRYLQARFAEQIGVSPKLAARLLRFEHVRRHIELDPPRWAEIAYAAGYSDQPHLNRDFRDLAGTTPSDFVARQIPGGGVVGDEIPFVQD